MSLLLDENHSKYQIRRYQPGSIQVNEQTYHNSIIIGQEILLSDWQPQLFSELTPAHFALILPLHPDILLLGTGSTLQFPPPSLYGDLINAGIGVEIMNTRTACMTYQALAAEGRNVLAALIIK